MIILWSRMMRAWRYSNRPALFYNAPLVNQQIPLDLEKCRQRETACTSRPHRDLSVALASLQSASSAAPRLWIYPSDAASLWVVGYPPGGATDILALADRPRLSTARPQFCESRTSPAAGHKIGTEALVSRALMAHCAC